MLRTPFASERIQMTDPATGIKIIQLTSYPTPSVHFPYDWPSITPDNERIVTVEDAAELRLSQIHVVPLETRPPNAEGKGEVTIRDLVRNALRMRPDRIVVGECRGGEALDMLQAMNTGHDGSLTTLHANSPTEAISRLETICLMSGLDLPGRE